jgi:hypothetical protein
VTATVCLQAWQYHWHAHLRPRAIPLTSRPCASRPFAASTTGQPFGDVSMRSIQHRPASVGGYSKALYSLVHNGYTCWPDDPGSSDLPNLIMLHGLIARIILCQCILMQRSVQSSCDARQCRQRQATAAKRHCCLSMQSIERPSVTRARYPSTHAAGSCAGAVTAANSKTTSVPSPTHLGSGGLPAAFYAPIIC